MSEISFIKTEKRCLKCGGHLKLERLSDGKIRTTNIFCEFMCFIKTSSKPIKTDHSWGEWIMKDGKTFLRNENMEKETEVHMRKLKKGFLRIMQ